MRGTNEGAHFGSDMSDARRLPSATQPRTFVKYISSEVSNHSPFYRVCVRGLRLVSAPTIIRLIFAE